MNATVATRLPVGGLLALSLAGFITILTEALPAGLLPQISADLDVSEALVGQLVTLYAIGSIVAAIPITTATLSWRRRPLLLTAVIGFAIANTVTAFSENYMITLTFRFVAGVSAGLLWALLAGYASRMVPTPMRGRAIAVAMAGIPVALCIGIPAGTLLGTLIGWRYTFMIISFLTVILVAWILWKVPDFPGQSSGSRMSLATALATPGVRSVLFVTLAFVLAHNILYTYIAPLLSAAGLVGDIDVMLLVFGVGAIASIWATGLLIDRYLRELVLVCTLLFLASTLAIGLGSHSPPILYAAVAVWGLAFGGSATLFQTACANTAGEAADLAQSMLVTVWNIAIAGGGILGGILLDWSGADSFSWALIVLLTACLLVTARAHRHGFPSSSGRIADDQSAEQPLA